MMIMLYVICGNIEPASLTSTNWVYVGLFNMVSNCLMKLGLSWIIQQGIKLFDEKLSSSNKQTTKNSTKKTPKIEK